MIENQLIKQNIKIGNKIVAEFLYKKNDTSVQKYINAFEKEYLELINFFKLKIPKKITIKFIYTRKEMDNLWGEKSPKWLCGMVDNKSIYKIYIFSPLVFEKLTTHKNKEIMPTIIHETAHVFVSQLNKKTFAWLNEGLCQYLENKHAKYKKVNKKDIAWFKENKIFYDSDMSWGEQAKHNGYKISYNLVKKIIEKHGKEKIFKLLKINRSGNTKEVKNKFDKIIKISLNF